MIGLPDLIGRALLPGDTAVHIPLDTSPRPASRQRHQGLWDRASQSHSPADNSVPPTLALASTALACR